MWSFYQPASQPVNGLYWSTWNGAAWRTQAVLYADAGPQDTDDWTLYAAADDDVHLVRRTLAGGFDYAHFDGQAWSTAAAPAVLAEGGPGLFLAGASSGLALYAIAPDGSIATASWNGIAWSAWSTLISPGAPRQYLTGYVSGSGGSAIVWTEGQAAPYRIAGALLP
jgi:hypothetical protein